MELQQAFVLRLKPGRKGEPQNRTQEALDNNVIMIGWAMKEMLKQEWAEFRQTVKDNFFADKDYCTVDHARCTVDHARCTADDKRLAADKAKLAAAHASGKAWRFLHEMQKGDWVAVPDAGNFYVAQIIADEFTFDPGDGGKLVETFQRKVEWLNNKQSIPRDKANERLYTLMNLPPTLIRATDCLQNIKDILAGISDSSDSQTT